MVDENLNQRKMEISFKDVANFFPYLKNFEEQAVDPDDFCKFQNQLSDPENDMMNEDNFILINSENNPTPSQSVNDEEEDTDPLLSAYQKDLELEPRCSSQS